VKIDRFSSTDGRESPATPDVLRTGLASDKKTSTDNPETAASVTVGAITYRARCTEAGRKNVGRLLFIYADAGGRPIAHPVLCHAHARMRLACDRAAGREVL
jgi:hypothetical protein